MALIDKTQAVCYLLDGVLIVFEQDLRPVYDFLVYQFPRGFPGVLLAERRKVFG